MLGRLQKKITSGSKKIVTAEKLLSLCLVNKNEVDWSVYCQFWQNLELEATVNKVMHICVQELERILKAAEAVSSKPSKKDLRESSAEQSALVPMSRKQDEMANEVLVLLNTLIYIALFHPMVSKEDQMLKSTLETLSTLKRHPAVRQSSHSQAIVDKFTDVAKFTQRQNSMVNGILVECYTDVAAMQASMMAKFSMKASAPSMHSKMKSGNSLSNSKNASMLNVLSELENEVGPKGAFQLPSFAPHQISKQFPYFFVYLRENILKHGTGEDRNKLFSELLRNLKSVQMQVRQSDAFLGQVMILLHMLLNFLMVAPTSCLDYLSEAANVVKPITNWPYPFSHVASRVLTVIQAEAKFPGHQFREKLFEDFGRSLPAALTQHMQDGGFGVDGKRNLLSNIAVADKLMDGVVQSLSEDAVLACDMTVFSDSSNPLLSVHKAVLHSTETNLAPSLHELLRGMLLNTLQYDVVLDGEKRGSRRPLQEIDVGNPNLVVPHAFEGESLARNFCRVVLQFDTNAAYTHRRQSSAGSEKEANSVLSHQRIRVKTAHAIVSESLVEGPVKGVSIREYAEPDRNDVDEIEPISAAVVPTPFEFAPDMALPDLHFSFTNARPQSAEPVIEQQEAEGESQQPAYLGGGDYYAMLEKAVREVLAGRDSNSACSVRPVVKLCVMGGNRALHQFLCAYIAFGSKYKGIASKVAGRHIYNMYIYKYKYVYVLCVCI
jgi:hypothetical protein